MRAALTVLPEKYSERNIMTSMMGVLNDYIPLSQGRAGFCDEQVFWVKFEDSDCCGLPDEFSFPLILSIGTCKNFYLWGLSLNGRALLLFSERNLCTIDAKLLPTPHSGSDNFEKKRPILALCDVRGRTCCFWQVRFMSLADGSSVHTHSFESKALSVDANLKYVLVARLDCITVLNARTLEECFTIARVRPTIWSTSVPRNVPYSLSTRWLAFSDSKPVLQNLSRCGDESTEEPLTSAVMNVNKKIWSSLSAIANTVVPSASGAGSGSFRHDSAHPVYRPSDQPAMAPIGPLDPTWTVVEDMPNLDSSTNSPGYVTVVDLEVLHTNFLSKNLGEGAKSTVPVSTGDSDATDANSNKTTSAVPNKPDSSSTSISGTMYLDVHENSGNGSVVAHFMAHRWASVALIKFDSTGTLLFTACTRGHAFNVFRISNHPCDHRQTAVHHLYILERGNIPCEVMDATFSRDARWLAVSTNHGTTHVFPITPYGGPVTVRTHTRPYVVNRTSRYHRSSGLEEHHLTRPQPERGAPETIPGSSLARPSTPASSEHTRVSRLSSPPVPGSTHSSHGAPVPILIHQSPGTAARLGGNSDDPNQCEFQSPTPGSMATTYDRSGVSETTLTCSCNAFYNTTNPRLPPYPEPCQIKPEARLRPHNPANSTSGAAAAALGAATGALEVVTTGYAPAAPVSRASHHVSMYRSPQHCGPCAHYPASAYLAQFPHQRDFSRCQPLPIVDQDSGMSSGLLSTVTMAARFALPICFLPNHPRSSGLFSDGARDSYGSRARAVNSLFILTPDLYLVEYDLSVGPAEATNFGEKLYQDGSIRLDCSAVGQWNLRTDLVYPPPFPQNHPFAMNLRKVQPDRKTSEISTKLDESPKNESECAASVKEGELPKEPTEVHSRRSDETTVQSVIHDPRDSALEDNASYWYSQVEITTHLGPLRRVWMGPQFTFRTYSKQDDSSSFESNPSNVDSLTLTTHSTLSDILTSLNTAKQLLPPIIESSILSAVYGSSKRSEIGLARAADLSLGVGDMGSSCEKSYASGTNLLIPESKAAGASSPLKGQSKSSGGSRSQSGRLLEGHGGPGSPAVRWRNRSGDLTRPMSITGPLGDVIENSIVIEGGSYQDSSLGGSLSSLAGRNAEDVVSCIAEAIQDEDVYWPNEKSTAESDHPSSLLRQSTPQASVLQFNVRAPVLQPTTIVVQSALSEADFPNQEASPSVHEESAHFVVGSFPESTVIGGLEVPDESNPSAGGQDVDVASKESGGPLPTSSELTTRNVKKGKRPKKSRNKVRKSGSTSAISQMQGDSDSGKNIQSSMTSPCPSCLDSLSTSPDVSNPLVAVPDKNLPNLSPLVTEGTKNEDSSQLDDANNKSNLNLTICNPNETQGEPTEVDSSANEPKPSEPTNSEQPDSKDSSTLVSAENTSSVTANTVEENKNAEATPAENRNQPPTEEANQTSSENPQ